VSLATDAWLLAEIPTLGAGQVLLRLGLAAALGTAVGFERELRDREAGMRTHLLVALGSCLFTLVSAYGFHEFLTAGGNVVRADPARIAAQIVTGIGFLGAGAIIREGLSVRGLTTAGSLWVVAAIGMASGAGYYTAAIFTTVLTLFALGPMRILGYQIVERFRQEENRIVVELPEGQGMHDLLEVLPDVRQIEIEDERDRRVVTLELDSVDDELIARLSDLPYVISVRWHR
jgi:putative Mg2+ transporter-C (MgtC) family protein